MGTTLIDNFDYRGKRFLDSRQSVATLAALKAMPDTQLPDGFRAYCAEDKQWYEFNSANEVDATTGKWRPAGACLQETGNSEYQPMSQKSVTDIYKNISIPVLGIDETLEVVSTAASTLVCDINITAGIPFKVAYYSSDDIGSNAGINFRYEGEKGWSTGDTLTVNTPKVITTDRNISGLRLYIDTRTSGLSGQARFTVAAGMKLDVEILKERADNADNTISGLTSAIEKNETDTAVVSGGRVLYTDSAEANGLIRELYIENPEPDTIYRIKHIWLRKTGSYMMIEDKSAGSEAYVETRIVLGAKENFNNKVLTAKIGDATIYVVLNTDHEDFEAEDRNHSNLLGILSPSAFDLNTSPVIFGYLERQKLESLTQSVGDISSAVSGTVANVAELAKKIVPLTGTGGPVIEPVEWQYGYYKEDMSVDADTPTSIWRRCDILLKSTDRVKVKATLTTNPIVYCHITDENGTALWSKAGFTGGEIDLSEYSQARHVLLSADGNKEYSAEVIYPEIIGLGEKVDALTEKVDALETGSNGDSLANFPDVSKMKVLVIGDSISTGDNPYGFPNYGNYDKWVDNLKTWGFFPADTVNNSLHASGFVAENPNTKLKIGDVSYKNSFLERTKYLVDKGDIDLSTFDLIVVFGGINDFKDTSVEMGTAGSGDTTKFIPALEEFYKYLLENAIQARICVILPLRVSFGDTFRNVTIWEFSDAIKSVIRTYSLPYLDLTTQSGFCPGGNIGRTLFNPMWTRDFDGTGNGDGVHPNAAYNLKYLSPQIMRFIRSII